MNIENGGSAFPALHTIDGNWNKAPDPEYLGMTMRDYFAGQALVASYMNGFAGPQDADRAKLCYATADAMLAERAK